MKKLLFISFALLTVLIVSCNKKDDPPDVNDYTGTWIGVYTGDGDSGSWTATIDSNGDVTGSATSSTFMATFDLLGNIDPQGAFTATAGSASTGSQFVGQFDATTASGTWSNTTMEISGNWSGTKQ